MNFVKKFTTLIYILVLLLLMVSAISNDALLNLIRNLGRQNHNEGVLVGFFSYFKHADAWNYIFLILFFAICLALFMGYNLLVNKFLNWISYKHRKLTWLRSSFADYSLQYPLSFILLAVTFLSVSNIYVPYFANKYTVESISEIDKPMPAFVLGTSKMLSSGRGENLYYRQRIDAAMELYNSGKVTFFILSGDGGMERKDGYNETRDMRNDLLAEGVPDDKIKIDTAGFRTLDSMLRLRALFKLNDIIIVSQAFHTPRAIVLGHFYGINCIAYNSKGSATNGMMLRELGSRPRMIMDLIFFNMQPKVTDEKGKALEYREAFEAKSDLHILILLGTLFLAFIMIMGYGVYQSHTGEERKKAAKKYSIIGSAITVAVVVMVLSVYKNADFKFVDEGVEAVAKVFGVKTEKMTIKEEKKETILEEIKAQTTYTSSIAQPMLVANSTPEQVVEEKSLEFNHANNERKEEVKEIVVIEETKEPEEVDLFNDAIKKDDGEDYQTETEKVTANTSIMKLTCKVHSTITAGQSDKVLLRLETSTKIGNKTYSKNHLFECDLLIYNGRYVVIYEANGEIFKNYQSQKEGYTIEPRHNESDGAITLSEGETIILSNRKS